jgi:hypothetical protein
MLNCQQRKNDMNTLITELTSRPVRKSRATSFRKLNVSTGLAVMVSSDAASDLSRRYLVETLNGKLFPARGKTAQVEAELRKMERIETSATAKFLRFELAA